MKLDFSAYFIAKAIDFPNSELDLLNLKIIHPDRFQQPELPAFESELYIVPKSRDLGIVALAEIVIALFFSKRVFQRNGKPAYLSQIAAAFSRIFNVDFGSIYDQQEKVFDRKPFNRAKALYFLRSLIIRKDKKNLDKQDEKQPFCNSLYINTLLKTLGGVAGYSSFFASVFCRALQYQSIEITNY